MKKQALLFFFVGLVNLLQAQTKSISHPLEIGEIRTIHSEILQEDRVLNIYLPSTYSSDTITYPVIYLLDGSMNEDFLHVVGLCEFFNLMYTMPPCIVVGIANVDRKRDFTFATPLKELQEKYPTTGGSARFISFIENELQPFIKQTYRTNNEKTLIGQSLGGLLASEILLKKPGLFNQYFITSPSLWWDNESLLKGTGALSIPSGTNVFISVGKEGPIMVGGAKKLHALLQKNTSDIKLDYTYLANENHATILHNSLYQAFLKLYQERY